MGVSTKFQKLAESPKLRLSITLALTVIIAFLCSLCASQVAPDGVLKWSQFFRVASVRILLVASAIWVWVNVQFLKHDQDVWRFSDDGFCLAHIRKTQLEGYAAQVRRDPGKAALVDVNKVLSDLKVKTE